MNSVRVLNATRRPPSKLTPEPDGASPCLNPRVPPGGFSVRSTPREAPPANQNFPTKGAGFISHFVQSAGSKGSYVTVPETYTAAFAAKVKECATAGAKNPYSAAVRQFPDLYKLEAKASGLFRMD